jgi:hypothetical protein
MELMTKLFPLVKHQNIPEHMSYILKNPHKFLSKYTKIGIVGMQIYHLATLNIGLEIEFG